MRIVRGTGFPFIAPPLPGSTPGPISFGATRSPECLLPEPLAPNCVSRNDDDGMIFVAGDNNQIYNNVLYNGKNGGITVRYNDPDGNLIANNSFCSITPQLAGGAARGIRIDAGAATTTVRNNVVFQVATPILNEGTGTIGLPDNWTIGDPLYRVPCTDLHLTTASSATVRQGARISRPCSPPIKRACRARRRGPWAPMSLGRRPPRSS